MRLVVDAVSYKVFALIATLATIFLVIAFIVGAAGPDTYDRKVWSAYQCPKNSHHWNSEVCVGVQLGQGVNTSWTKEFPQFSAMNMLWLLEATPFKNQNVSTAGQDRRLKFAVTIYGSSDEKQWDTIVRDDEHVNQLNCESDDDECDTFVLVDIQNLEYSFYRVAIWLPPSDGKEYVGDVVFRLYYYNRDYTDMELSFRLCYLMVSLLLLIIFLWRLRKVPVADWDFEQKGVVILLVALTLLNDPFYPLEFWVRGWFFEFVHSVFETIFTSVLLMFWLFVVEKQRKGDDMRFGLTHLPEFALVLVYTCISTALFTLIRVRAAEDPVYGEHDDLVAEIVLFYIVAISYAMLIVWFMVETVLAVAVVSRNHLPIRRLVYFGLPSLFCVLSIIIAMFAGTLGPFNRTSLGFVYFFALYNVYVWIMVAGFWPVEKLGYIDPSADEPSEISPISPNQATPAPASTPTIRPTERNSILSLHDNL